MLLFIYFVCLFVCFDNRELAENHVKGRRRAKDVSVHQTEAHFCHNPCFIYYCCFITVIALLQPSKCNLYRKYNWITEKLKCISTQEASYLFPRTFFLLASQRENLNLPLYSYCFVSTGCFDEQLVQLSVWGFLVMRLADWGCGY